MISRVKVCKTIQKTIWFYVCNAHYNENTCQTRKSKVDVGNKYGTAVWRWFMNLLTWKKAVIGTMDNLPEALPEIENKQGIRVEPLDVNKGSNTIPLWLEWKNRLEQSSLMFVLGTLLKRSLGFTVLFFVDVPPWGHMALSRLFRASKIMVE